MPTSRVREVGRRCIDAAVVASRFPFCGKPIKVLAAGAAFLLLVIGIAPLQAGRLNFSPAPGAYVETGTYTGLYLADMTNDGVADILFGNRATDSLEIWQYNQDQLRLAQIDTIGFGYDVHDVKAADFDHDGDKDIVVGLRNGGLMLATNSGGSGIVGSWDVRQLLEEYVWQVLVGDLDGDGHLDIVDCTDYGPIYTFYGDGHGNFTRGANIVVSDTDMRSPHGFTLIDHNGDSRPDLIGLDGSHMRAFVNPGNRSAAWTSIGNILLGDYPSLRPHQAGANVGPAAGDLNSDGSIDQVAIVGTPEETGPVNIIVLWGNGALWVPVTLDTIPNRGWAGHIGVADLDGDGHLDIHVGGADRFDGLRVYLGDGLGHFTREDIPLGHGLGGLNAFAFGDVNGDGSADIVTARFQNSGGSGGGFTLLFGPTRPTDGFWTTECVDCPPRLSNPGVLTQRSLQMDAAGLPHIALGGNNLVYAWHNGQTWRTEVADFGLGEGVGYPALALDAAGRPHISYRSGVDQSLRYAYRTAAGWQSETVESELGFYDEPTSLALDSAGRPHIAYTVNDRDSGDTRTVKYAFKDDFGWVTERVVVDAHGQSLALAADGTPRLSLLSGGMLHYALRDADGNWHIHNVLSQTAESTSIAVVGPNDVHIAYEDGGVIKEAFYFGVWTASVVSRGGDNRNPSLAIDNTGAIHILYDNESDHTARHAYWAMGELREGVVASDRAGDVVSLALDAAGRPRAVYLQAPVGPDGYTVRYKQASRPSGPWWSWDNGNTVIQERWASTPSMALAPSSLPVVSYCERQGDGLMLARRGANGWTFETVDGTAGECSVSSLALDNTNKAHVAYMKGNPVDLKYARQTSSGWQLETAATGANGYAFTMAVDAAARPHLVYRQYTDGEDSLIYAYRTSAGWQRETLVTGDRFGHEPALALDSQGRPHVVYENSRDPVGELRYAYRDANGWHTETIDSTEPFYLSTSLAVGSDGTPHVVYSWLGGPWVKITYAHRGAGGWQQEFVAQFREPPEVGGLLPVLALGPDNRPHVAYSDLYTFDTVRYGTREWDGWHFQTLPGYAGTPALAVDRTEQVHMVNGFDNAILYLTLRHIATPVGDPEGFLSAGEYHTCGLRPNGQADCWGAQVAANNAGQAADQPGPFTQVGAGAGHSCGLKRDGSIECWGSNIYGQAADDLGPFVQLSVGGDHNCGLIAGGRIVCWGRDVNGETVFVDGPFVQVGAGWLYTCALRPDGGVECWGRNLHGEARDQAGPFTQISVGWGHACGLQPNDGVHCWGRNSDGQAEDQAGPFTQISAGGRHTCGLKPNGAVECWGLNSGGQAADQAGPYVQVSAGGTWLDHSEAWGQTCAIRPTGSVDCWGSNENGQAADQGGVFGPFGPSVRLPIIIDK